MMIQKKVPWEVYYHCYWYCDIICENQSKFCYLNLSTFKGGNNLNDFTQSWNLFQICYVLSILWILIANKLLYLPFIFKVLFVNCHIKLLSLWIKLFVTATFHHDFVICLVSFWWIKNNIFHRKSIWRVVESWCFAVKCAQDHQLLRYSNPMNERLT